jgi:hypothetical protein
MYRSARRWRAGAVVALLALAAAGVLHTRPPVLMRPLRSFRAGVTLAAAEVAVSADPRSALLLDAMADTTGDAGIAARDRLTKIGKPAVSSLIRRLRHADPNIRAAAALVLGNIRDARAVRPLMAVLRDPSEQVRYRSAYALGRIKDERAVAGLAALLLDPSPVVVSTAARSLEECQCKVHLRTPQPGFRIRPRGHAEWQVIAPPDGRE